MTNPRPSQQLNERKISRRAPRQARRCDQRTQGGDLQTSLPIEGSHRKSGHFPNKPAAHRTPARKQTKRPSAQFDLPSKWEFKSRSQNDRDAAIAAINAFESSAIADPIEALAIYRSLRAKVPVSQCPHPVAAVNLAIAVLPKYTPISRVDLQALIGGDVRGNREAYHTICTACHYIPPRWRGIETDHKNPLEEELQTLIGPVPRTALDGLAAGSANEPDLRICFRLAGFKDQCVRINASLALYIRTANGASINTQRNLVHAYALLDRAVSGIPDNQPDTRQRALDAVLTDYSCSIRTLETFRTEWRFCAKMIAEHIAGNELLEARIGNFPLPLPANTDVPVVRIKQPTFAQEIARIENYLAVAHGQPEVILARYRSLRAAVRLKSFAHPERVLDLAVMIMGPQGIQKQTLHLLIGGPRKQLDVAYADLVKRFAQVPHSKVVIDYKPDDPLGPWLLEQLGTLPETALDPLYAEMLNSPDLRSRVHIFALQIPAVRLLAGATLFLSAARRLRPRYFHDISTFRLFEKKLIEAGVKMEQSTGFEANASADSDVAASKSLETGLAAAAVRAILNDETLSADRRVAVYNSIVWNITRLDRLSVSYPEFADRYRPWRIAVPTDMLQQIKRRLQHRAQSERIARRESTCAVAATDPGAVYRAYDSRFGEIEQIREAFDDQCALIEAGKIKFDQGRVRFSVTLPCTDADSSLAIGGLTLDFAVVTPRSLARQNASLSESALGASNADAFLLEYLGPRDPEDRLKLLRDGTVRPGPCEPPILAMYRAGCFQAAQYASPALLAKREALLPPARWPQSYAATQMFRFISKKHNIFAGRCLQVGIILLPIHELHFAQAVGRAAGRSILRGARIGEVMQQLAQRGSFTPSATSGENLWKYEAIAKMKTFAEAFYLSAQDMEAVLDVMRITARNGWSPKVVKPAVILKAKCRPATYLYQRSGRSLCISQVNMLLALPMWPHSHRAHDLRHGIARHHHHNGMSRKAIASFLHHSSSNMPSAHREQKWSSPLDTYIRPVPSMLAELLNLLDKYYNGEDRA